MLIQAAAMELGSVWLSFAPHPERQEPAKKALNLPEDLEQYSILHDRSSHAEGLGFEVHITWPLNPDHPDPAWQNLTFHARGGETALRRIVDTYKLAGKRYTVIWDEE